MIILALRIPGALMCIRKISMKGPLGISGGFGPILGFVTIFVVRMIIIIYMAEYLGDIIYRLISRK